MTKFQEDEVKWDPQQFFNSEFDPLISEPQVSMAEQIRSDVLGASDEQLEESIAEILHNSRKVHADEIQVDVDNHNVTLSGVVQDEEEKVHTEEIVKLIEGVGDIHNDLKIESGKLAS